MVTVDNLVFALILWLLLSGLAVVLHARGGPTGGLVSAYLLGLWLLHWLGASIYALPWYAKPLAQVVVDGSSQSLVALLGFLLGVLLARVLASPAVRAAGVGLAEPRPSELAPNYLVLGLAGTCWRSRRRRMWRR